MRPELPNLLNEIERMCDDGHAPIIHLGWNCPLCDVLDELSAAPELPFDLRMALEDKD